MAIKEILGSLSPAYGLATGEGMLGQLLNPKKAAEIADKIKEEDEKKKEAVLEQQRRKRMAQRRGMGAARPGMKKGGSTKKMAKGGKASSASKRGDGCAMRGKTKGKMR